MFLATKGCVQLEVQLNGEIKITPMVSAMELMQTAKAIAKSISSILNFQTKNLTQTDKEAAVKKYLASKGWKVEN